VHRWVKRLEIAVLLVSLTPVLAWSGTPPGLAQNAARSDYFALRLGLNGMNLGDETAGIAELQALPPIHTNNGWQSVGPNPVADEAMLGPNGYCPPSPLAPASGRATAIAFGAEGAIYLGAAGGGVWKSIDGGTTWASLTDTQPSLAVGAIAVVPGANPSQDEVYVGTGEANNSADSQYGQGILKSDDGGQTWTQLGLSTFAYDSFARLAVIPGQAGSPDTIYAATTRGSVGGRASVQPPSSVAGLYKSSDGGNTWSLLSGNGGLPAWDGINGAATDVAISPGNPATVFAAISCIKDCFSGGVFRSEDSGATWSHLDAPSFSPRIALWVPTATQLYAAFAGGHFDQLFGVFHSSDGGNTWQPQRFELPQVGPGGCLPDNQATYNLALGGDPAVPTTVYLGLIGLYRSTDGGNRWSYTIDQSHSDFHAVAVNQGTIYALNDGGLSVSTNGTNWSQKLNVGLATLQFTGAALGPQTANLAYGGMQDNDLAIYTGNPQWLSGNTIADGGFTAIPPAGDVIFGETQGIHLLRSTVAQPDLNLDITPPVDRGERALFYAPFSLDPSNGDRILYGTRRIWESCAEGVCNATTGGTTDGSSQTPVNWSAISPPLNPGCVEDTEGGPIEHCLVTDVRVAPTNPAILYAVTANFGTMGPFAWVSTNSTSSHPTFTNISSGLPAAPLESVAISPVNPSTVVVAVGGFTSGGGHLFESTDQGSNWSDISSEASGFPNLPVTKVLFDANDTTGQTLIVATAAGLLRTTDNGKSWQNFTQNLPLAQIFDLDQNPNYLLAATHGRSVWVLDTAVSGGSVTTVAANSSAVAGQPVAGGTIQITNSGASTANLIALTVGASNPTLFSSMALTGGGAAAQINAVSTANTFHFSPPLAISVGQSVSLSLSAMLAQSPTSTTTTATTANGSGGSMAVRLASWRLSLPVSPLAGVLLGLCALGMVLLVRVAGYPWVPAIAGGMLMVFIITQGGCGGSSSPADGSHTALGSSSQTVTQVWLASSGQSLQVTGLPASMGSITATN